MEEKVKLWSCSHCRESSSERFPADNFGLIFMKEHFRIFHPGEYEKMPGDEILLKVLNED